MLQRKYKGIAKDNEDWPTFESLQAKYKGIPKEKQQNMKNSQISQGEYKEIAKEE